MYFWKKLAQAIDTLAELLGRIGWLIILYCMTFGVYDVIMRYAFNSPSLWIGTTLQYAMVMLACLAGAYALKHDAFVKLDLFYANFSPRKKAICDIITFMWTFLYLSVLIWKGSQAAMASFAMRQVTPTAIPIPIYHLKALIPFGAFCVMLVALKKLVMDLRTVIRYEER